MSNLISINLVVLNGKKYIGHCMDAVLAQTYPHNLIELNILDNGSTDGTIEIIENYKPKTTNYKQVNFVKSKINLGVWPGQEELLKHTNGKYVICLCVDVLMDKDFIKNAAAVLDKDEKIGALQPKIYKYDASRDFRNSEFIIPDSKIIDTCGFKIFRSRRVVNIGHGEPDGENYGKQQEIFAVEGAVPIFKKEALESCRIILPTHRLTGLQTEIADHDFFWYGDDLDLAWRLRLFGWKEVFAPNVVAWHDRQTSKSVKKNWTDYIFRIRERRKISIKKRGWDWRNLRWTFIKNDYIINILRDLPWIAAREISVLGYSVLFEPGVLKEVPAFFRFIPKMLKKRKEIMAKQIYGPKEIRKWFN